MIIDHIKNIQKYSYLNIPVDKIIEFIEYYNKAHLEDRRYDILGDDLFALVQSYKTIARGEGEWESHKEYIDLQYIDRGTEVMYWTLADELIVREDHTPEKDILFYENAPHKASIILEKGMFALLLTHDAHMPCCEAGKQEKMRKIVFKIKCKH
ncbi:MAG: uncharacterized protein K0S71_2016 [Clostridia bacterium]|jgi:YhcH/YjgK/YiaL family protein|nr:uncharacterized protein [Clostridia bacterium]